MSSSSSEATALVDVTMPQMGVSVAEGTIVSWRVEVGDRIGAEETICEISTDKIDTEVPAPVAGVVAEIVVEVGTTVSVGTVLARIAPSDGGGGAAGPAGPAGGQGAPVADAPVEASPAAEPAPSRSEMPVAAAGNGATSARPDATGGQTAHGNGNGAGSRSGPGNGRRYSPVVLRIAAEHGIDLSMVKGTGREGRVRKQDVMALVSGGGGASVEEPPLHIESPYRPDPVPAAAPSGATPGAAPAPASGAGAAPAGAAAGPGAGAGMPLPSAGGELSRMRRQIGQHMKRSLETAATCTTWIEVDMTNVQLARKRLGVTALSFVARAAIEALREYPALNAWLEGETYTRHQDVNLGIAVSLGEDGLIVPVIPRAHELSVEGLAARIRELAGRARNRQLTPDDVRGGTFTITNPGQYGAIMATPIINQPQVAILDLETIVKRPVVITDQFGNDSIAIRQMTILGLSWDHRAMDGAEAAQFLAVMKRRLEAVEAS